MGAASPATPRRILIADDNPIDLRILRSLLVAWGYQLVVATEGEAAWQVLQQDDSPRLVILDWVMPGLSGIDLCRRVRACVDKPYIFLLLLTGKTEKEEMIRALDAGADDFISKPFLPGELQARLRVGERILQLQDELLASREVLRYDATHDLLTALCNRAEISRILDRELSRTAREQSILSVALADIDHFKQVNDTFGHAAGDAMLREVAQRLAHSVRVYDSVGRYGGEEFLIVLPSCPVAGVRSQAERVRQSLAAQPVEVPGGSITITLSLGVACTGGAEPASAHDLLRAADNALYLAKANGRNRVELAPQLVTVPAGRRVAEPSPGRARETKGDNRESQSARRG